ncbi:26.2 kDa heat shock protein, mitochondrial-like [Phragmites australis]|uniref:26.2 kDa heat shock protein, mitochondrial-like n=1 Tax=Phragmites australis TaxID=29695 RepID=UPI002D768076|nr:26.2 kDa heat shock protein, mitochondrial-like [Phragmites australis]
MAFAVASKGAPLTGLLKKLLLATSSASGGAPIAYALRPAIVTAARRFFNTEGAPLRRDDYDLDESSDDADAVDVSCRTRDFSVPVFFSADVLDPFGAPTSLGRLLALMEDDASAAAPRTTGFSAAALRRGWWVSKEDDDAVQLKVAMPGLGKEHVKVRAEQNIVVIKGEGDKEFEDDDNEESSPSRYSHRIELPADAFKMDQVRAEMKNGLLRVTVPKVKEEERKDVFQVKVE